MIVKFDQGQKFACKLTGEKSFNAGFGEIYKSPIYVGPYEAEPNQSTQTLNTKGRLLTENIIIGPMPQNYGLITWNGSTLTVS